MQQPRRQYQSEAQSAVESQVGPKSHVCSSQPSGGASSPKQTSHSSGSHGLPHSSICGVQVVQAFRLSKEQSGLPFKKMCTSPLSVCTVQQPKQSQPGGVN
jgi:hypothetical protein